MLCWDDRSKWEIYNEKIHRRLHSVHNSKVIRTCLARGNIFENAGFPKETRQNVPFIKKYTSTSHHHHYHVVPLARISLTLSRHFSLSLIASGRLSGLHPVSSHSCCMYVLAGRPAFARPYVGVHRTTSLMSSSLFSSSDLHAWFV